MLEEGEPNIWGRTYRAGGFSKRQHGHFCLVSQGYTWNCTRVPSALLEDWSSLPTCALEAGLPQNEIKYVRSRFDPERNKVINDEVDRLLEIRVIEECFYPVWLCNLIVVQKKNDKLRICMDFAHLNKVCPEDSYPLSQIDQVIDATTGYNLRKGEIKNKKKLSKVSAYLHITFDLIGWKNGIWHDLLI